MNGYVCMCLSKGNPFMHVRNCWIPFMESIAGLIELKTYHDDACHWKKSSKRKRLRIRKFEQKFWVLLNCVFTSCGSVFKSFHLNAVHIRERVQWMAHNATNNDNDSFSNFFATSSNIFVSKFQSNCEVRLNSQFVRLPIALVATLFCPAIIAGTTDVVCIFPHNNAIALIISSVSKRISIKVLAQTQSLHMFNTCSCFFHFKLRQKKTFHSDYLLFMDVVYFVWFVDIVEFHCLQC